VEMQPEGKSPVSRQPDEVRRRILDAAEAEFMAEGYEAASTNRIVTRFAGSKATLFRYYPTKELLLQAVIERIAGDWRKCIDPSLMPADDPASWLAEFGAATLDWILGDGPLFLGRLGISEGRKLPQLSHLFHDLAGAPLTNEVARQVARWRDEGRLRSDDPDADARSYFDLVVAGAVSRALYGVERPRAQQLHAHVDHAVDIFLKGRGPR